MPATDQKWFSKVRQATADEFLEEFEDPYSYVDVEFEQYEEELEPEVTPNNINHSFSVNVDPALQLSLNVRRDLIKTNIMYSVVFDPKQHVYNHAFGRFEAQINIGAVKPPQHKGTSPQYNKDRLDDLLAKFDKLEAAGVFQRPERVGVKVKNVSTSFLIHKKNGVNGSYCLVTAFCDVARLSTDA